MNYFKYFPTKLEGGSWVSEDFPPFASEPPAMNCKSVYFIVDARTGEVFENALTEREALYAYENWSEGPAHDAKNLVVQAIRTIEAAQEGDK